MYDIKLYLSSGELLHRMLVAGKEGGLYGFAPCGDAGDVFALLMLYAGQCLS
jgi:hypothetical protein